MTDRPLSINLGHALPLRPRPLGQDALSRVFGGCHFEYQSCTTDADCCVVNNQTLRCLYNSTFGRFQCKG